MSVKIYVGNLSYDLSEEELKELFEQHGEVSSVQIITDRFSGRSKGFAFVEMAEKDNAESAIEKLDGASLLNRNIKVNLAKPRTENTHRQSNRY